MSRHLFRSLFLLVFLLPQLAWASVADILRSPLSERLLLDTRTGRALLAMILDRSEAKIFSLLDPELLPALRRGRVDNGIGMELELRLRIAESRYRAARGLGESEAMEIAATDKELIERLAGDLLLAVRRGELKFVHRPPEVAALTAETQTGAKGAAKAAEKFLASAPSPATAAQREELARLYQVNADQIHFTPRNHWPGVIRGLRPRQMAPKVTGTVVRDPQIYDQVIVGGGPAGLTSAMVLSDEGNRVLVLEAAPKFGGLATGETAAGARFGAGAAYYAAPSRAQFKIFQRIGLNNYTKLNKIQTNIDSLLLDGVLYKEFWEHETLEHLPRSFKLYKHAVERMEAMGMIADQPVEAAADLTLDAFTAKEWVNKMPEWVAGLQDPASKKVYAEFLSDPRVDPRDPMRDVFKYLDPYGRSALGGTTDQVNAMSFFNFQASELVPRYTGQMGTGEVTERMANFLASRRQGFVTLKTSSPAARIIPHGDHVEVLYVNGGTTYATVGKTVLYTAPLKYAPRLIQGFETVAPKHARALEQIPFTDYIVTNVITDGHPTRGTYDFWFGDTDNQKLWITDMIDGRFQQFGTGPRSDKVGVVTLYQPKSQEWIKNFSAEEALAASEAGVEQLQKLMGPTLKMTWGSEIKPKFIVTNLYPASIQVTGPGYFTKIAPVFRQPIADRIYVAGIANGTPSLEEAMYSAERVAEELMVRGLAKRR